MRIYFKKSSKSKVEILAAPKGAKVVSNNSIEWETSQSDRGKYKFKIRVENEKQEVSFDLFTVNVITKEMALNIKGNLAQLENLD